MAAPTTTGLCALLLEDFRFEMPDAPDPRNSTLKMMLAHTAEDRGNLGPDYQFGYGSVRVVDAIVQHVDLFPTILDVVGIEPIQALSGRSFLPLVTSGAWARPTYAISYLDLDDREAQSVTSPFGKLILHHYDIEASRLLFDLSTDPTELENLYAELPVLAGSLRWVLRAFDLAQQERLVPEQSEFPPEVRERLKALGYLD